ncbi:hypothetical protein DVH05_010887 [Phytophthora capsici]|nr:hypothetical protein DVH05_010887 [Phytophthora capsici]
MVSAPSLLDVNSLRVCPSCFLVQLLPLGHSSFRYKLSRPRPKNGESAYERYGAAAGAHDASQTDAGHSGRRELSGSPSISQLVRSHLHRYWWHCW